LNPFVSQHVLFVSFVSKRQGRKTKNARKEGATNGDWIRLGTEKPDPVS